MADFWAKKERPHTRIFFNFLGRFKSIIDAAITVEETICFLVPQFSQSKVLSKGLLQAGGQVTARHALTTLSGSPQQKEALAPHVFMIVFFWSPLISEAPLGSDLFKVQPQQNATLTGNGSDLQPAMQTKQ